MNILPVTSCGRCGGRGEGHLLLRGARYGEGGRIVDSDARVGFELNRGPRLDNKGRTRLHLDIARHHVRAVCGRPCGVGAHCALDVHAAAGRDRLRMVGTPVWGEVDHGKVPIIGVVIDGCRDSRSLLRPPVIPAGIKGGCAPVAGGTGEIVVLGVVKDVAVMDDGLGRLATIIARVNALQIVSDGAMGDFGGTAAVNVNSVLGVLDNGMDDGPTAAGSEIDSPPVPCRRRCRGRGEGHLLLRCARYGEGGRIVDSDADVRCKLNGISSPYLQRITWRYCN